MTFRVANTPIILYAQIYPEPKDDRMHVQVTVDVHHPFDGHRCDRLDGAVQGFGRHVCHWRIHHQHAIASMMSKVGVDPSFS